MEEIFFLVILDMKTKYSNSTRQCFCFSNICIVWVEHCAQTMKRNTISIMSRGGYVRMKEK